MDALDTDGSVNERPTAFVTQVDLVTEKPMSPTATATICIPTMKSNWQRHHRRDKAMSHHHRGTDGTLVAYNVETWRKL